MPRAAHCTVYVSLLALLAGAWQSASPLRSAICGEANCDAAVGVSLLQRQAAPALDARPSSQLPPAAAALPQQEGSAPAEDMPNGRCTDQDFAQKDIDLIIYGATGVTGGLAATYLAGRDLPKLRWAIGGRNVAELEALRASFPKTASLPTLLVADLDDQSALRAMTKRARGVISYAGPYNKYSGENLIEAAVATCTHYADVSGEPPWKATVLETFGAAAEQRGVAVVNGIGLDSLPADVVAIAAAEALAEDGQGPPSDITVLWSSLMTLLSKGSASSFFDSVPDGAVIADAEHSYALAPDTPPEARVDVRPAGEPPHVGGPSRVGYDANFSTYTMTYPMGYIDGPTVRRSLSATFPGAPIHFAEVISQDAVRGLGKFIADELMNADDPLASMRGETPPEEYMLKGGFTVQGLALRGGPDRAEARMSLECKGDPGYYSTAKWSVDFALALAALGASTPGGFLTPSLALGSPKDTLDLMSKVDGGSLCKFWRG